MDIGPFPLFIQLDVHPVGNPLNHMPPGAVIELSAAAFAVEQVEFGEEREVAFSFDCGHVFKETEPNDLAVKR